MTTQENDHFLLETKEPFHWLRLKPSCQACQLVSPSKENSALFTLKFDAQHPRQLVFQEEFGLKHLLGADGTDYTAEARALFPAQENYQYML